MCRLSALMCHLSLAMLSQYFLFGVMVQSARSDFTSLYMHSKTSCTLDIIMLHVGLVSYTVTLIISHKLVELKQGVSSVILVNFDYITIN